MNFKDKQVMHASLTFHDTGTPGTVPLPRGLFILGSGPNADVLIEESGISPCHCALFHVRGEWKLLDLYSRQGTRVNGQSITDHKLRTGDEIKLGKVALTFKIASSDSPEEMGLVQLESTGGERFHMESGSLLIGSWDGCDIVVEDAEPAHVIVVNSHDGAMVRAIGESGSVIVNGRQTNGCVLQDEDVLWVGKEQFTVRAPHLPRRSDGEPVEDVRAHCEEPALCSVIEEQKRIVQLLGAVGQVPGEIEQLRVEISRQIQSLVKEMESSTDAARDREKQESDRAGEHTSQIQSLGRNLTEHGALIKGLLDRLERVVDAAESSKDATESAVGRIDEERARLSVELDSRDKTLQKVWEGLVQVREALASPSLDSSTAEAVGELREQVETLNTQFVDFRSQLPQKLKDAFESFAKAGQAGLAELAEQRAVLAEREEQTRLSLLEAEREHHRREQSLQRERQKLLALKIELEVREARTTDRASKLICLCQSVARLEGVDASSDLIAFARSIAGKVKQPGRVITSATKSAAAERPLHAPSSGDGLASSASRSVGSRPNSSRNS